MSKLPVQDGMVHFSEFETIVHGFRVNGNDLTPESVTIPGIKTLGDAQFQVCEILKVNFIATGRTIVEYDYKLDADRFRNLAKLEIKEY